MRQDWTDKLRLRLTKATEPLLIPRGGVGKKCDAAGATTHAEAALTHLEQAK
jgi:hypothetical protein